MLFTSALSVLAAALLSLPSASAHMIMKSPVPYGDPNNSPLSPSGSDFPCKIGGSGSYDVKTMNNWQAGSEQTLSFTGSAVHGGGSCQISVTMDKEPTKSSKFKVIHSIEGGCPGVNGPTDFKFPVPKDLPNGEYTMAWTWFNKIGNREMYMNCAPITVSGGSDGESALDKLPDMATANIGGDCKTAESSDYTFENPGDSVQKAGSGPFVALCGGASGSSPGAAPGNGQQSQAPAGTPNNGLYTPPASAGAPASTQAPAAPSEAPAVSSAPAVGPSDAPVASPVTSTVRTLLTVTAPAGQPSAAPSPSAGAPSAQPSQAPAAGGNGSCSEDGATVCNGADQFGICNHGSVVWQPVAAGTTCQNGQITKRDYTHRAQRASIGF